MNKKSNNLQKNKTLQSILVLISCVFFIASCTQKNEWHLLFNGKELPDYPHYLGRPDKTIELPHLMRDSLGNYLESLGTTDPLNVYSVDVLDGDPVIRISGQVIGGLLLSDSIANYHLRLKFKWGDHKWDWMEGRPKDGGILYHQVKGARQELQIHEGDVGSYWSRKVALDIPARYTYEIPESIKTAKPFLLELVNTLYDSMLIFDAEAPLHHFDGIGGPNDWQIVIANPYNENPHGEWNTLELICYENHAVHMINGEVNLILLNSYYRKDGNLVPLSSGRLALQSEGAVIFFKDIEMKYLTDLPDILRSYLQE